MKNIVNDLIAQKDVFFRFMKEKYPVHQNSNIFLRDIQYAIKSYFEKKEIFLRSDKAELAAREFINFLLADNQISPINSFTWKVLFSTGEKSKEEPQPENEK